MDKLIVKLTLSSLLMFGLFTGYGQKKYDTNVTAGQLTLEGKSINGYTTTFDFSREDVRKGWWKYAREFGSPLNMKTYYKVTVPSETNEGNVDLVIFTQTTAGEGGTRFFLGLESKQYNEQAKAMIADFKKRFYINDLVDQIEVKQKEADRLSDEYRNTILKKNQQEILKKIADIENEVEQLKSLLKSIEKS